MNTNTKILLIFFLFYIQMNAQTPWPVPPHNHQHTVAGTSGEYRNTNRFHQGVDIFNSVNGGNQNVYAIEDGIVTNIVTTQGNNNYVEVTSQAGELKYIHVNIDSNEPLAINDSVYAGTNPTKIGIMVNQTSIHVHLEDHARNFLNNRLLPYADNESPEIDAYSFRFDGHTRTNSTSEYNTISFNGNNYNLLFGKVDIVLNVEDPTGGYTLAPYAASYKLFNKDTTIMNIGDNGTNMKFEDIPQDAAAISCFGNGTTFSPANYNYILTAHPGTMPYDRYWNTRLGATNAPENTWPSHDDLSTSVNKTAYYEEERYFIKFYARDVDYNSVDTDATTFNQDSTTYIPLIIDNFRPYITHLEVREGIGEIAPLIYQGQWDWNGTNLQLAPFNNPISNKIPPHTDGQQDLEIFLKTSEYMKELTIDIFDAAGSYNASFFTTSNMEKTEWTITIPASAIPSTAFGDQTVKITGKDRTNNDVLGFNTQYSYAANQLPHRVGSGSTYTTANWSVAFPTTTDQVHIFEISDCVYNEGGNKKSNNGNDCLADFSATANYQNASLCGLSNPIPYFHPNDGGFFVLNNQGGQISLDASTSISTSPNPLAFLDYEWYFYPDNPVSFSANGPTNNIYWTTPGDKVIELRIQCDGACSTKRINVAVAESPCTETKTPVFEPDQMIPTDIVASFLHPSACEYVGQPNCQNTGNFNNGQIITNPNYFGASGCYELDVYEVVGNTEVVVEQNLYETDAYAIDCLEEGIYRVVMKDNVSSCVIEQFVYLRDKNPVISYSITPSYIGCDGNTDKGIVSAYIEEPLGCATMVEIEGGGEGPATSIELGAGSQTINVYLDQTIYLSNQTIDIPQEQAETELTLSYNVTSTSGSNQCDGSVAATASNGSGNYTYTVDNGGSTSGLCSGAHTLTATDNETTCSITVPFDVYAQINKPNHDIITVFTLHPNPFNDLVNISVTCEQLAPGDNSPIPVIITIYNSSGGHALTVYNGNLAPQQNHTFPVDVSSLSSGTYIFTIEALGQGESLMGVKN